jgi:hypothetical protein
VLDVQVDAERDPPPSSVAAIGRGRLSPSRASRQRSEKGAGGDQQLDVPCQRPKLERSAAEVLVADQTPITDAPSDAYSSEFFDPAWNMKNATVAKNIG